jgi:hypothetical protein
MSMQQLLTVSMIELHVWFTASKVEVIHSDKDAPTTISIIGVATPFTGKIRPTEPR